MTMRVVISFIAATFLYSGYVLAAPRPSKPVASSNKPAVTQKKPTVPKVVQPKWKLFTVPDGSFTVLMPGTPKKLTQVQKTQMGKIDLHIYFAEPPQQQVAYLVTYNEFPYSYAQMTDPQEIFNDAQSVALKTTKSNLVYQRNIRSSNYHVGQEIKYVNSIGKVTRTRMFFANGRLYQVTAIASKKQYKTLSKTIEGFLDSFQLVVKK
jgi:hypothetical protein